MPEPLAFITGCVVHGKHIGTSLGFPTANIEPDRPCTLAYGVYKAFIDWDGERHPAMVNVGQHPTFPEGLPTIEAHIPDFSGDIYGKNVALTFTRRIRGEKQFAGASELIAQISLDLEELKQEDPA